MKLICAATLLFFTSTARLQRQMMALGRWGGCGADELLSFPEQVMIRQRGGGQGRSWTGAEREICGFFSSAAWEIAGNGEKRREKESKRGQVKYFPLWQRK